MNFFIDSKSKPEQSNLFETQTPNGIVRSELPLESPGSLMKPTNSTSSLSRWFRHQIHHRFNSLRRGRLNVVDANESVQFGSDENPNDLEATVLVGDSTFYRKVTLGGTIGSAESYADGDWVTDDLTSLVRIMIRNMDRFNSLEKTWALVKKSWQFLQHRRQKNTIAGSQRNIHAHYDLGNDFYKLFLDSTMNYSSGIFSSLDADESDGREMLAASNRKMDQICRKLQLGANDHVLEIGTGWGGLAVYMAEHFGCQVTTTTISKEQYQYACARVEKAGLSDRVTVLLKDYRLLKGKYDKIVSVEMIEAVGHEFYDEFFGQCSELLADDGVMLLQAITIGEQNFDYHIRHVDFIRKYIFPGGCLPSVTALASSVGRVSDMRMLFQEDLTPHYAKTLACWRSQFMSRMTEVRACGFDERFIRLWHFYLCYCEAAFAERRVHCIHLVFAKPQSTVDPVVDYRDTEHGLIPSSRFSRVESRITV